MIKNAPPVVLHDPTRPEMIHTIVMSGLTNGFDHPDIDQTLRRYGYQIDKPMEPYIARPIVSRTNFEQWQYPDNGDWQLYGRKHPHDNAYSYTGNVVRITFPNLFAHVLRYLYQHQRVSDAWDILASTLLHRAEGKHLFNGRLLTLYTHYHKDYNDLLGVLHRLFRELKDELHWEYDGMLVYNDQWNAYDGLVTFVGRLSAQEAHERLQQKFAHLDYEIETWAAVVNTSPPTFYDMLGEASNGRTHDADQPAGFSDGVCAFYRKRKLEALLACIDSNTDPQ